MEASMKKKIIVILSCLLLGVSIWFLLMRQDTNLKVIEERIDVDFKVVESKNHKEFLDKPEYYSLILLTDSDYEKLVEDWKASLSQNFEYTEFFEEFSSFNTVKSYKRIESGDFDNYTVFTSYLEDLYQYEYYFFMGEGQIAVFSFTS